MGWLIRTWQGYLGLDDNVKKEKKPLGMLMLTIRIMTIMTIMRRRMIRETQPLSYDNKDDDDNNDGGNDDDNDQGDSATEETLHLQLQASQRRTFPQVFFKYCHHYYFVLD